MPPAGSVSCCAPPARTGAPRPACTDPRRDSCPSPTCRPPAAAPHRGRHHRGELAHRHVAAEQIHRLEHRRALRQFDGIQGARRRRAAARCAATRRSRCCPAVRRPCRAWRSPRSGRRPRRAPAARSHVTKRDRLSMSPPYSSLRRLISGLRNELGRYRCPKCSSTASKPASTATCAASPNWSTTWRSRRRVISRQYAERRRVDEPARRHGVHAGQFLRRHHPGMAQLRRDRRAGRVNRVGQPAQPREGRPAHHDLAGRAGALRATTQQYATVVIPTPPSAKPGESRSSPR